MTDRTAPMPGDEPTTPPHIRTHEPTGIAVGYRDEGLILSWETDPPTWQVLPLGDQVDLGITAANGLADCAASGEDHDLGRLAVSTTADGSKVALLWLEHEGSVNALVIPRGAVPALVEQMWRAVDDRDVLIRHDAMIDDATPEDFR